MGNRVYLNPSDYIPKTLLDIEESITILGSAYKPNEIEKLKTAAERLNKICIKSKKMLQVVDFMLNLDGSGATIRYWH